MEVSEQEESLFTAALALEMNWENPFHPRYAHKSRFFMNETHAMKSRFMSNLGIYPYKRSKIQGMKVTSLILPFNEVSTGLVTDGEL